MSLENAQKAINIKDALPETSYNSLIKKDRKQRDFNCVFF